jgi:thiol-disulfide isomerase/thioredoxin
MRSPIAARLSACLAALAPLVTACSSTSSDPQFAEGGSGTVVLPGPPGAERINASPSDPQDLPGVDTSELVPRERRQWWKLVSQLYAPCPEQAVSIAACVKEDRPCAACPAAARMLASRVRSGATVAECEAVYGARFGPNIKKPDITGSPARGPDDALVTIVVWSDFQCPACKHTLPIIDQVAAKHANHVRLVHKFYPLKFHTHAEVAAKAAVAAHNQGRYWQMEKILFDNQNALTETDLDRYAKAVGLDMARFHADMSSEKTVAVIQRDKSEADKAGLSGTPFILINGRELMLSLFRPDTELEPWVALEVDLVQRTRAMQQGAAPPPEGAPGGAAKPSGSPN